MDKNTVIGLILMAGILIGFTLWNKPSDEEIAKLEQKRIVDSIANRQATEQALDLSKLENNDSISQENIEKEFFTPQVTAAQDSVNDKVFENSKKDETLYTLENSKIKATISSKGGQLHSLQVKDYKAYNLSTSEPTDSLYLFNGDANFGVELKFSQGKTLNTENLDFVSAQKNQDSKLILTFKTQNEQYINFIYTLSEDDYLLDYDIQLIGMQELLDYQTLDIVHFKWSQKIRQLEKTHKQEQQNSGIRYKRRKGDVQEMHATKVESLEIQEPTKWVAFKNQFFSSILVSDNLIENAILESTPLAEDSPYLKSVGASLYLQANHDEAKNIISTSIKFYFGPLGYTHLKSYDEGLSEQQQNHFEELVPLGWFIFHIINEYFVIPIFYWLSSTGLGMGLVILLLTLIVKVVISPLTYKSYISSAKMRVLKPQVDEISAKYPKPEQATEKQKAIMSLYSRAGANPMSGCIPMLLQMPVLIALFRFFPNAIELRQKSFLWATDLSTYDSIITFPFSIPLLGDHLSLFCILMTITNVIYTKFNMQMTSGGQDQMPGMKMMMYIMPIAFLFILNDFPSGLTYYYFISLLITILLTLVFRYTVDEKKILAKLEANKAKPKKKSGFMARLEEAQKTQEQQRKRKK